ncbi:MAG: hypothetical protein JWR42_594, partial [Marmoricola sp.]|nr:hypothetical protein [Marmoricola sp.]
MLESNTCSQAVLSVVGAEMDT